MLPLPEAPAELCQRRSDNGYNIPAETVEETRQRANEADVFPKTSLLAALFWLKVGSANAIQGLIKLTYSSSSMCEEVAPKDLCHLCEIRVKRLRRDQIGLVLHTVIGSEFYLAYLWLNQPHETWYVIVALFNKIPIATRLKLFSCGPSDCQAAAKVVAGVPLYVSKQTAVIICSGGWNKAQQGHWVVLVVKYGIICFQMPVRECEPEPLLETILLSWRLCWFVSFITARECICNTRNSAHFTQCTSAGEFLKFASFWKSYQLITFYCACNLLWMTSRQPYPPSR